MGPGVVGTGTTLGTTAIEVAPILDAAAALGGRPVIALRVSDGDPRDRHQGVSHHSQTVLRPRAQLGARDRPRPDRATPSAIAVVAVDGPDTPTLLADRGLQVTTMGRGPDEDPAFFAAAGAAGALVAQLLDAE